MNTATQPLEKALEALVESRDDVATAVHLVPSYKADLERRIAEATKQLDKHEETIKDIEAYLAKQQDSTFEVYEVWMGRNKFATYATREQADVVVNSTSASLGAHVSVTTVLGSQAKQQVEQEPFASTKALHQRIEYLKSLSDNGLHTNLPTQMSSGACFELALELERLLPLYATPQAREPLSDDEIEQIFQSAVDSDDEVHIRFARAIETKLGVTK